MGRVERRVISAITACRTAALGGHVEQCADCGATRIAYNSCRNRHCPKCQGRRAPNGLPHARPSCCRCRISTSSSPLPAPIAEIAFQNKAVVYDILFRTAAETLRTIAADPEASRRRDRLPRRAAHLGPEPAPPSACPLRRARRRSVARRQRVGRLPAGLLPAGARALAAVPPPVPRTTCGPPSRPAASASSATCRARRSRRLRPPLARLRRVDWVVYAKPPFGGPAQVLAYLGRYTHRVAIANSPPGQP